MKKLLFLLLLTGCRSPEPVAPVSTPTSPTTPGVPAIPNSLAISNIVSSILTDAASAAYANPHYASPLTDLSILSVVGANPTPGLTNAYFAVNTDTIDARAPFAYYGGEPKVTFRSFLRFPVAHIASTGGNTEDGYSATAYRVGFNTDAPVVNVAVLGNSGYRFIVDGRYVSQKNTSVTTGGGQFIQLDFTNMGGARPRLIQLEGETSSGFLGVVVPASAKVWKPAPKPRLLFVGDSYTLGAAVPNAADGYARVAGDFLGVPDTWMSGVGGTGYTATANGGYNFAQRVTDWTTKNPDVVVFAGGLNDADDNALQPAVLSLLQTTRTALPNAIIMVLGVFPAATGPNDALLSKERKIAAAVRQFADPYTRFIPIATDPIGSWVTGTGRAGSPTGVGNSDVVTGTDGTHPSVYGYLYYGQRVATEITKTLRSLR